MQSPATPQDSGPMNWPAYLRGRLSGKTQAALADLGNVPRSTLSRWIKGTQTPDAPTAIQFARAIGDDPLNALVAVGYLTAEEARQQPSAPQSPAALTDDELLAEVRARMRREEVVGSEQFGTAPIVTTEQPAAGTAAPDGERAAPGVSDDAGAATRTPAQRIGQVGGPTEVTVPLPKKRSRGGRRSRPDTQSRTSPGEES